MRLLLLTFYYPPDLSAGSFRMGAFVEELQRSVPGVHVDVLTTQPNRYKTFRIPAEEVETVDGATIRRFSIPAHKSGMLDQSRAFATFARQAYRYTRGRSYDIVLATSSRLFTASLGALVAPRVGAKLYLDIRDIFAETIDDVLGRSPARLGVPLVDALEKATIRRADRVNVVSPGFVDHFRKIDPEKNYTVFTNGIDDLFLAHDYDRAPRREVRRVVYAGNMGEGQGLERIIPKLAAATLGRFEFVLFGDGGTRERLINAVQNQDVKNVEIRDPVQRADLVNVYADADVLFIHANDLPAFRRFLPFKMFEYAATGKPILAGVSGVAANFLGKNVTNAAIFAPCDVEGAVRALEQLAFQQTDRSQFIETFNRRSIMREMVADVLSLGSTTSG